jgi:cell division protein FtsQ
MKLDLSKVKNTVMWVTLILVFIASISYAKSKQAEMLCKEVIINIDDESGNYFVENDDIKELLNNKGKKLSGFELNNINISLLETLIENNPYVENAEVYSTIDGTLYISIQQREPVIRIITTKDDQYYIDKEGRFMPLSEKFTARVPVASGNLFTAFGDLSIPVIERTCDSLGIKKPVVCDVYKIARELMQDEFWDAQLEQIYVNSDNEVELIPRVGNHRILIGNSDNLKEKLDNLMVFYTKGLNNIGWEKYSTINMKYKGQVVCTLRN